MNEIFNDSCLNISKYVAPKSVNCIVTSPPYYGLRDYGVAGQIGLEQTPQDYVNKLVEVFRSCREVLKDDGTIWLNLGDCYYNYRPGKGQALVKQSCASNNQDLPQTCARRGNKLDGLKEKDLIGIPWRVAFALQADGWYLRQEIIWHKPNPMPESVRDRCTKSHEQIFLLSKHPHYYYDATSIMEECNGNAHSRISKAEIDRITRLRDAGASTATGCGRLSAKVHAVDGMVKQNASFENAACLPVAKRNKRDVWTVATKPCKEAHFATFPPELIRPCVLAGCPKGGVVLDPFMGAGTTALVALQEGRQYLGFELNKDYIDITSKRLEPVKSKEQQETGHEREN